MGLGIIGRALGMDDGWKPFDNIRNMRNDKFEHEKEMEQMRLDYQKGLDAQMFEQQELDRAANAESLNMITNMGMQSNAQNMEMLSAMTNQVSGNAAAWDKTLGTNTSDATGTAKSEEDSDPSSQYAMPDWS